MPSEFEKGIQREKESLEKQHTEAKQDLTRAQQELQQAAATQHREIAEMRKELEKMRLESASSSKRAESLQERVHELEAAVPAHENARLVSQLQRTQAELIKELTELQSAGGLEPLRARGRTPGSKPATAGRAGAPGGEDMLMIDDGLDKLRVTEATRENEALKQHVAALEEQLGTFGSLDDVRLLRFQVNELEASQIKLEKERSELKRRTAFAEEQLKEVQAYVDANLGRYQREIVKLRQILAKAGVPYS